MYHLLCGATPDIEPEQSSRRFPNVTEKNPIVPLELSELIAACLEQTPSNRPHGVDEIAEDLLHLGFTGDSGSHNAPANLARFVLNTVPAEELEYLGESLKLKGLRSVRSGSENLKDLIGEYCYTTPPDEILEGHFTNRQLRELAGRMGVTVHPDRKVLVRSLVMALGFLPGRLPVEGVYSAIEYLGRQAWALEHGGTSDEITGIALSSLGAVERIVDMFNSFFAQLLYGRGAKHYLNGFARRPDGILTLGQKVEAFRTLLLEPPSRRLPHRYSKVFTWPIVTKWIETELGKLVANRNQLAHEPSSIGDLTGYGRAIVNSTLAVVRELAENPCCPRSVQIQSKEIDCYGRQFYSGREDQGKVERIFTPLPLNVGECYLFYPLTNPARVHPLLFPMKSR
jgi:hypothetical protein